MFDRLSASRRIVVLYSISTLPLLLLALWLLAGYVNSFIHVVTAGVLLSALWAWGAYQLVDQSMTQIRTLSSLVEAARVGDYSLRGGRSKNDDELGELHRQVNQLMLFLSERRQFLFGYEQLIEKALRDLDVGIFVFDDSYRLKMLNPAAASLLGIVEGEALNKHARELDMLALLKSEDGVQEYQFSAGNGPWQIRKDRYRSEGAEQTLIFVSDLAKVLRTEELNAWRRIIRVMSHEVNNSLTPLVSIAQSLKYFSPSIPEASRDDYELALDTIESRSKGLSEFIQRYATVAKLPTPNLVQVELSDVVRSAYQSLNLPAPDLAVVKPVFVDAHQLEQALINLVKNGVEANQQAGVTEAPIATLNEHKGRVQLSIKDRGHGIQNPSNLFVPFYTTKPNGSGIGLTLSRQIIEANGGALTLDNHVDGGCEVLISLAPHHGV